MSIMIHSSINWLHHNSDGLSTVPEACEHHRNLNMLLVLGEGGYRLSQYVLSLTVGCVIIIKVYTINIKYTI